MGAAAKQALTAEIEGILSDAQRELDQIELLAQSEKLRGPRGYPGRDGKDGKNGRDGKDGSDGRDGKDGDDGHDGRDGRDGEDGDSAYKIWLRQGHVGTEADFLASLKGRDGRDGVSRGGGGGGKGEKGDPGTIVAVSDTPPENPSVGDLWVDTS